MSVSVAVVAPFAGHCPHRRAAWEFCRAKLTYPVTVAEGPAEPWCKGALGGPAIEASTADVIAVCDADVFLPEGLGEAVAAVEGGAPWSIAHKSVRRLSREGTAAVLAGEPWEGQPLDQPPYRGMEGGGAFVARREVLLDCPMDPRFVGWGGDDECLALALRCLYGPPWRGKAPLVHCWHPHPQRASRRWGSAEHRALYRRYQRAKDDPAAMRRLLEEADHDRQSADPARDAA